MPYGCEDDGFEEAMDYEFNASFDSISEAYRATSNDAFEMAATEAEDEAEFQLYLDFWGAEYGPYANPGSSAWSIAASMGEQTTEFGPYVAPTYVDPLSTYFF